MTTSITSQTATHISIGAHVPYSELSPFLAKATEDIGKETEIEGFRKGKAPLDMVKQRVGEFKILQEASRRYIEKHYTAILLDLEKDHFAGKSFEPIGQPVITITKLAIGETLEFSLALTLLPPVVLPDYQAISKHILTGRQSISVSDEELETSRQWLRESRAKLISVDRPAQIGDRVEIDFSISAQGVPIEGGSSKNHPFILGKGRFLPGFEDALLGMRTGEEKTFPIDVPANYHAAEIAGKILESKTKMCLVQERILPEWNDDFARSLGNFSSTAEVEESIRKGLEVEKETKERERLRMAVIEAIANETRATIPDPLIERELEKMLAELKDSIERMGSSFEDYLTHIKKTPELLKSEWSKDAERRVKIALTLREIARVNSIVPSDAEIEETKNRIRAHQRLSDQEIQHLDQQALGEYNRGIARNEKVFQYLESLAEPSA